MTDLVARLEGAEGPSAELIFATWRAIHPTPLTSQKDLKAHANLGLRIKRLLDNEAWESAALLVLPSGLDWELDNFGADHGRKSSCRICVGDDWVEGTSRFDAPALAICIAALRAREEGGA